MHAEEKGKVIPSMKTTALTRIALLCALCAVLGFLESLFPPFIPISGAKIGLSNLAVLFAIMRFDTKEAFFVAFIKVLIVCFWFSGLNALFYSLLGTVFSFIAMKLLIKMKFSAISAGVGGGIFHNIGQIFAAAILLGTKNVFYLSPYLLLLGGLCGLITGIISQLANKYIPKNF